MSKIELSVSQKKKIQRIELDMLIELDRICQKFEITYILAFGTLLGAVRHKGFIPWDDDIDVYMLRSDYEKFKQICKTELDDKYFYQTNETDPEYYHLFDKIRANNTVFKETFLEKYNIHHGVYIDIFPVDNIPNNWIKRKLQYYAYHFYRNGLMSKYMMTSARMGKKKYIAKIFKVVYAPYKLKTLYDKACKIAERYNDTIANNVHCFCSPYKSKDIQKRSYYNNVCRMPFEGELLLVPRDYDNLLKNIYGQYMTLPPIEQQLTRHNLSELKL